MSDEAILALAIVIAGAVVAVALATAAFFVARREMEDDYAPPVCGIMIASAAFCCLIFSVGAGSEVLKDKHRTAEIKP